MERELSAPIAIAHPDGRLVRDAIGWARHPIHACTFAASVSRVARFNYWCITNRTCALTLLLADVGFAGVVLVSFVELDGRSPTECIRVRPGGLPKPLPDTPRGDVVVDAWRMRLAMRHRGDQLRIEGDATTIFGTNIAIDLGVDRPSTHETMNVLVPWDDVRFHFTSKQQALPVTGTVRVGGVEHRFDESNDAFACLDFGRGRYPSRVDWNWGFGSGRQGGRTIGLNLGGKWTDGTGVTENGVVVDGRIHKIADAVDFEYDPRARKQAWRIRTRTTSRLDLQFRPIRERTVYVPLGFVRAELHQLMGVYDGTFVDDAGESIAIDSMIGLAESFNGRWPSS